MIKLICTPLRFYTPNDEDLLFTWLEKIQSIQKIEGVGRELHLFIPSTVIPDDDLCDLMGVFDRYKFDAQQLEVFKTEHNKDWFEED
jgi:hypothetical protein